MEFNKQEDWICFISQTGGEVIDIIFKIKRKPNVIVTNNIEKIPSKNLAIFDTLQIPIEELPSNPSINDYFFILSKYYNTKLITLHGYLRIIPGEIINSFQDHMNGMIINGHPAYIRKYPELKGKDPQIKVIDKEKYPEIGHTIHRVIEEVDAGKIILDSVVDNDCNDIDQIFSKLKIVSLSNWSVFLNQLFN